jgi:CubicO group peptidase (beta-lactamase class C family)
VAAVLSACAARTSANTAPRFFPGREWTLVDPALVSVDAEGLEAARDYALSAGGSGCITRHGRLVMRWGDARRTYDLKSTSKSIGVTALGLAIADGKIALSDPAVRHHPDLGAPPVSNRTTQWIPQVTILHLATQTAGFEKPGGYGKLLFEPGTRWLYSDAGPNWLAECVTLVYRRDVQELLFERVFSPIGIGRKDLRWRNNAYRPRTIEGVARREFGSGVHANVDAMTRIGLLYLRKGNWNGRQLLTAPFVAKVRNPVSGVIGLPEHPANHEKDNSSDHYGLLWWNNADGALDGVPRDAYWSWGLHDSLILVIPSLDVVASRTGRSWPRRKGATMYAVLRPFFEPIVSAVSAEARAAGKATTRVAGIRWAPPETVFRAAQGSDNWPATWADDGALYTAYGDGWGFEPKRKGKLSLGLARVTGTPGDLRGVNLDAPTAEQTGDGPSGKKASGMLMVDGKLYMLARNAKNAQLAWSADRGATWKWCDWTFETSFGCPTFLNFGRNYTGAPDNYVYLFSPDGNSAYRPSDYTVLARVPRSRLASRVAYEFFAGLDNADRPEWTRDVKKRGAVLSNAGRCYRTGVSYNSALGRYLLVQTHGGRGGLTIFEAVEPWGPWCVIYEREQWDVDPGDSASFPTQWMSADGRTMHLLFSGNDSFSVRRAELVLR